jgi:hypothetical protein
MVGLLAARRCPGSNDARVRSLDRIVQTRDKNNLRAPTPRNCLEHDISSRSEPLIVMFETLSRRRTG